MTQESHVLSAKEISRLSQLSDSLIDAHEHLMDQLVALRKSNKLSQDEIASRMGVSQPTVAAFERYDSNPTLASVRRYALAIGARIQNSVIDDESSESRVFEALASSFHSKSSTDKKMGKKFAQSSTGFQYSAVIGTSRRPVNVALRSSS